MCLLFIADLIYVKWHIENISRKVETTDASNHDKKKGMVLSFKPHSITFDEITYSGDMPQVSSLANFHLNVGLQVLKFRAFFTEEKWYWIGVGALIGFTIFFNFCYTVALTFLGRECHHFGFMVLKWELM